MGSVMSQDEVDALLKGVETDEVIGEDEDEEYDPEEVIVCPSQMKLSHATMVDVPDDVSLIVNIIVSDTFPQGGFP